MLSTMILAVALQPPGGIADDPGLARGMALVERGEAAAAVAELDAAVRRLAAARRPELLAVAHLHLAAAYARLGQDKAARASFREALHWSPGVRFARGRQPSAVIALFAEVLRESGRGGPPPEVEGGVWYEMPSDDCCLEAGLPPGTRQLVVDAAGGGDFRSLAAAIRSEGAVRVRVRPGTYRESLVLDRPAVLVGDGPRESIVIEGPGAPAIALAFAFAVVEGVTLRTSGGAAVAIDVPQGHLTLRRCDVGGDARSGVAVRDSGAVVLDESEVHDAADAGVVASAGGRAVVQGGALRRCRFGALARGGRLEVRRTRIERSSAHGLLLEAGAHGTIEAADVSGSGTSELALSGAEAAVVGGRYHDGRRGIVAIAGARLAMEDVAVFGHASTGVLLDSAASATVRRGRVARNEEMGILLDSSEAQLEDARVEDNRIGGLVVRRGGTATARRGEFRHNRGYGVLVLAGGRATVEGAVASDNHAGSFKAEKGGVLSRGTARE